MDAWPLILALVLVAPALGLATTSTEERLLVRLPAPLDLRARETLEATGARIHGFVPPAMYLVSAPPGALDGLGPLVFARALAPHEKLAPGLPRSETMVSVAIFPDADPAAALARLTAAGLHVERSVTTERMHVARGTATSPWTLAEDPDVLWVEPAGIDAHLDNADASALVQGGGLDAWPLHERGINGSTQRIAYCDTGLNTDALAGVGAGAPTHELFSDPPHVLAQNVPHPFHRKVALYYAPIENGLRGDLDDAVGHGTHVAGTLAGDAGAPGTRDGQDGVAFAAKLIVCDAANGASFQVLADYANYWRPAYEAGARIHSNSWGTIDAGGYGLKASMHDAFAWDHRDMLILRSAGNTGPDGPLRAEASAKSALAIGSTTNTAPPSLSAFSAHGPARDGRVKPDLVAPGECVTSADLLAPTRYVCLSGTSYATPVAAGAAALVRDHYEKVDAHPATSALVRATLVATAAPVAGAPASGHGWGMVRLDALGTDAPLRFWDETSPLSTGATWSTHVAVGQGPVVVALAWTDQPALPGVASALVNDLDLRVIGEDGTSYRGNAIAEGASLANATTADRVNVVELVRLPNASGTLRIDVDAAQVPLGPQPFALIVLGAHADA